MTQYVEGLDNYSLARGGNANTSLFFISHLAWMVLNGYGWDTHDTDVKYLVWIMVLRLVEHHTFGCIRTCLLSALSLLGVQPALGNDLCQYPQDGQQLDARLLQQTPDIKSWLGACVYIVTGLFLPSCGSSECRHACIIHLAVHVETTVQYTATVAAVQVAVR
eukprot:6187215-Pleurochrysis_carterae.AAC.3